MKPKPLSRESTRDVWSTAAKAAEAEGRHEEAEQMRATAKLWDSGLIRNWKGQIAGWQ